MLQSNNRKRWAVVASIVVVLVLLGVLVYRFAYQEGYRTAGLEGDAELSQVRAEVSSTATALMQLSDTYSQTASLLRGPSLRAGETGKIANWSITVTRVEGTDTITVSKGTGQVMQPHIGKFWLIRLRASSEVGNSLKFLKWYVLDTKGNIHQETASDPNYRFDASLYEFYQEQRTPPLQVEWLSGTTGEDALLIFDIPADVSPVKLIIQANNHHIIFDLVSS
ncbi:MAG: hypothetical protein M3437_00450 [Chloroflexota bacterium]|nr:hypothetical protein [Chloroflexota bacterium]MDQ5865142.1 hypothetical protein [Chloroflexota bacterium]